MSIIRCEEDRIRLRDFYSSLNIHINSINVTHVGLVSLEEAYRKNCPTVDQIEASLYKANKINYKPTESNVLAILNNEFSHIGVTFLILKPTSEKQSINYPDSGVAYGECDTTNGLIYIYITDRFIKLFSDKANITDEIYTKLSEDLNSQIAHEMIHRDQIEFSKVPLLVKSSKEIMGKDTSTDYLANDKEIDAFARQLAHELSHKMSYAKAISLLKIGIHSKELAEYPAYKIYHNKFGVIAEFVYKALKQDPNFKVKAYQKECINIWKKFRLRIVYFLSSLFENHFKEPPHDLLLEDIFTG